MKGTTISIVLLIGLLCASLTAFAQQAPQQLASSSLDTGSDRVDNELIVQLHPGERIERLLPYLNQPHQSAVLYVRQVAASLNMHLLRFDPVYWPDNSLMEWLERQSAVQAIQYNYQVEFRTAPNDPEYNFQWGAERIGMPEVWDLTHGGLSAAGDTIVVAILDSGFDLEHEDLQGNIWENTFEIPGDEVDNDNNGYVDDINGWDYNSESPEIAYGDHGLAVAGVLGARGNNDQGIAGINWDVKMMFFTITYVDEIISAYEYVIEQRRRYNQSGGQEGSFVVATNASFGLATPMFCDEQPLWGSMYDLMGEEGILTGAGAANRDLDIDEVGDIPTSCESDFLITVLNGTEEEQKQSTSAYGLTSIDMAAPGENSYSLRILNGYGTFNGNSAAAPHITGAIAMLYSLPCDLLAEEAVANPEETARLIRSALLEGVDPQLGYEGITATGGRLNVRNAMDIIANECGGSNGPLGLVNLYPNPANDLLTIVYETPDIEPYEFRIYNAFGQLVYRNQDIPNRFSEKTLEVDVSDWPQGLYLVSIKRGEEQYTQKLVVTR